MNDSKCLDDRLGLRGRAKMGREFDDQLMIDKYLAAVGRLRPLATAFKTP